MAPPIRCNKRTLKVKANKDYSEVIFIGDVHLGSPQCDEERFLRMLQYAQDSRTYIFLMGDLLETATRTSIGSGVYEQTSIVQSQMEQMTEWLMPLAKRNLILGLHRGNHENRVYEQTGCDISRLMAKELNVPYLRDACWSQLLVGHQKYYLYTLHGRTGARFDGTSLLALERISVSFYADLVAMGHSHKCISSWVIGQRVVGGRVHEYKKHLLITGHYLTYDGGYGQTSGLPISKLGSPKVKFFPNTHDLHVSW